ncbi:cold-regulated protein 28-like [Hibiscus syriacus]|uniref:cold-regulated protein 28-like n=1 Tax=Hibiscus syriacus TaxID=106335 RepID=UPI00192336A9|nr:cold-regulated protein 28-like [Hibiscus syriacus]
MEGIWRTETRTSLDASAPELNPQMSPGVAHQEQNPRMDSLVTESATFTKWTDGKHRLYLKSMETSFVNQFYDSVNLLGSNTQKEKLPRPESSRQKHCTSSGQFKVLRDGCWKKVDFQRPGVQLQKTNDSHSLVASPWIQHFRSGSKSSVLASCTLQVSASSRVKNANNLDVLIRKLGINIVYFYSLYMISQVATVKIML